MENHFHAVVQSEQLPRVMADLKKFTAGKVLAHLKEERREWLCTLLVSGRAEHKSASVYQVWQEGSHPQAIYSDETMLQKIEYIHAVRCGGVGSPRPIIGGIAPRMSGCRARAAGSVGKRSFGCARRRSQSASLTLGTRGKTLVRAKRDSKVLRGAPRRPHLAAP